MEAWKELNVTLHIKSPDKRIREYKGKFDFSQYIPNIQLQYVVTRELQNFQVWMRKKKYDIALTEKNIDVTYHLNQNRRVDIDIAGDELCAEIKHFLAGYSSKPILVPEKANTKYVNTVTEVSHENLKCEIFWDQERHSYWITGKREDVLKAYQLFQKKTKELWFAVPSSISDKTLEWSIATTATTQYDDLYLKFEINTGADRRLTTHGGTFKVSEYLDMSVIQYMFTHDRKYFRSCTKAAGLSYQYSEGILTLACRSPLQCTDLDEIGVKVTNFIVHVTSIYSTQLLVVPEKICDEFSKKLNDWISGGENSLFADCVWMADQSAVSLVCSLEHCTENYIVLKDLLESCRTEPEYAQSPGEVFSSESQDKTTEKWNCTIEVPGVRQTTTSDSVEFYFENSERSGGSTVEDIRCKDGVYHITFENPDVVERVLKRKHKIEGVEVEVQKHIPFTVKPKKDNVRNGKFQVGNKYAEEDGGFLSFKTDAPTVKKKKTWMDKESTEADFEDEIFSEVTADLNPAIIGSQKDTQNMVTDLEKKFKVNIRKASKYRICVCANSLEKLLGINSTLLQNKQDEQMVKDQGLTLIMDEKEYNIFHFFAEDKKWFKDLENSLIFQSGRLHIPTHDKKVQEEILKHEKEIKEMHSHDYPLEKTDMKKAPNACCLLQRDYKDVHIYFKENANLILLTTNSYNSYLSAKHKIDVLLGRVKETGRGRNRRFGKKEDNENNQIPTTRLPFYGARALPISGASVTKSFVPVQGCLNPIRRFTGDYKTQEGILIKVYRGSITNLPVDCIVNTAYEQLTHGGGVAYAISGSVGYDFNRGRTEYIQNKSYLNVRECYTTSAGNLNYACIIHTVVPRWGGYRDRLQCLDILKKSVEITFIEAERLGLTSIAVPALGSGINGVPQRDCAEQYYRAVVSYSRNRKSTNLKEIHFVDMDYSMISTIQKTFDDMFNQYV